MITLFFFTMELAQGFFFPAELLSFTAQDCSSGVRLLDILKFAFLVCPPPPPFNLSFKTRVFSFTLTLRISSLHLLQDCKVKVAITESATINFTSSSTVYIRVYNLHHVCCLRHGRQIHKKETMRMDWQKNICLVCR